MYGGNASGGCSYIRRAIETTTQMKSVVQELPKIEQAEFIDNFIDADQAIEAISSACAAIGY